MPQEPNLPRPDSIAALGLWSTLRLVAGTAPVGAALGGVGGGVARGSAWFRSEKWRWEAGRSRRQVRACSRATPASQGKEERHSPVEASLRLGQWLEGLD